MKSRRENKTASEIAGALETARIAVVDDDQSVREGETQRWEILFKLGR